ncbi:MAG: hypothetical protein U0132_03515 [Gemmatimonadaceae bacterium]
MAIALVSSTTAAQTSATVILPGYRSPQQLDTIGTPKPVAAPAGRVFTAVAHAFDRYKITVDLRDSASLAIGGLKLQVTRVFMGTRLSRAVDCGTATGGRGERADFDRVHLAILATVRSTSSGTSELKLAVAAGSQTPGGTVAEHNACQSTGWIEEKLQQAVEEELAHGSG